MEIFFWDFCYEIVYLLLLLFIIFLAWLLNKKDGCDDLAGSVTPQASMKLSPPHRSPAFPHQGRRYSPLRRRCSPVWAAGTAGMAGTADSPAQGE